MKIGIITFHRAHNYGAVLQAYATKYFLRLNGYDACIIDYWPTYRRGMYDLVDCDILMYETMIKKIKYIIRTIICLPNKIRRYNRFNSFIYKYLDIKKKGYITSPNCMRDEYDIYIYGSDQIWRYNEIKKYSGFDLVYWGKYPKTSSAKKVAYAASMGIIKYDDEKIAFIKNMISNYDSLSVREADLKKFILSLTDMSVEHVLDPVFLLSKKDWINIISKGINENKRKYLLFYNVNESVSARKIAKNIAKKKGLKIIEINGHVSPFQNPFSNYQTAGPIQFIGLVYNASFVVSNSYHGVAFSILFQKQFYALDPGENSERVISLLSLLDLKNKFIAKLENVNIYEEIDYAMVGKKLEFEKNKSIEYLRNCINL